MHDSVFEANSTHNQAGMLDMGQVNNDCTWCHMAEMAESSEPHLHAQTSRVGGRFFRDPVGFGAYNPRRRPTAGVSIEDIVDTHTLSAQAGYYLLDRPKPCFPEQADPLALPFLVGLALDHGPIAIHRRETQLGVHFTHDGLAFRSHEPVHFPQFREEAERLSSQRATLRGEGPRCGSRLLVRLVGKCRSTGSRKDAACAMWAEDAARETIDRPPGVLDDVQQSDRDVNGKHADLAAQLQYLRRATSTMPGKEGISSRAQYMMASSGLVAVVSPRRSKTRRIRASTERSRK